MADYVVLIRTNWPMLKKLPKLYFSEIAKLKEPERMYLYAFYGYFDMLNKYNSAELSIKISTSGENLMIMAIYINNIKLIEYLESRGLDIHYKFYKSPYLTAVQTGNIKLIKYLENRGVNIYTKYDYPGLYIKNPYEIAVIYSHLRIVKRMNKNEIYNINYNYFKYSLNNKMKIFIIRQIKLRLNRFKITYI